MYSCASKMSSCLKTLFTSKTEKNKQKDILNVKWMHTSKLQRTEQDQQIEQLSDLVEKANVCIKIAGKGNHHLRVKNQENNFTRYFV